MRNDAPLSDDMITMSFGDYYYAMLDAQGYHAVVLHIFQENQNRPWSGQVKCNKLKKDQQKKLRIEENKFRTSTTETLEQYYNDCAGNAFMAMKLLFSKQNHETIISDRTTQEFFTRAFSNMLNSGNLFAREAGMYYALGHMKDVSLVMAMQQKYIGQAVRTGIAFLETGVDYFQLANAEETKEKLQNSWQKAEFCPGR